MATRAKARSTGIRVVDKALGSRKVWIGVIAMCAVTFQHPLGLTPAEVADIVEVSKWLIGALATVDVGLAVRGRYQNGGEA